jgi:hypothetical protein
VSALMGAGVLGLLLLVAAARLAAYRPPSASWSCSCSCAYTPVCAVQAPPVRGRTMAEDETEPVDAA